MSDDLERKFAELLFERPDVDDAPTDPPANVVPGEGGNPPADDDAAAARRFAADLLGGAA